MTTSQADINTNASSSATAGTTTTTTMAATAVSATASLSHNNSGADSGGSGGGGSGGGGGTLKQSMGHISNSNNGGSMANSAAISDMGKRKKLKSRTGGGGGGNALPLSASGGGGYTRDHLDAWLETCLKDASATQLSSSSEFLDYNPTNAAALTTSMPANNLNQKNMFSNMPPQQQQQQQQQQAAFNIAANMTQTQQQQQQQQTQQQHLQQQQQQQPFAIRTNPLSNNNSLPNSNSSFSFPFNQGYQRNMPNFMKPSSMNSFTNRYSMMFQPISSSYYPQNDGSQDFASLPPMMNMMGGSGGTSSEHENNSTDVLDGSASRGFRFSDPCLLNPSDNDSKISGQNTPDRRNTLSGEMEPNNKLFNVLMEQIQMLHETNSKICRDLHEAKVCIEVLKHAPNLGMRHRRDSISGLSTHSQPLVFGSGFGTHSPAPSFHSGAYTPGIMTDVVREVKDAARVREDALLNRVKSLVEERQWSINESNLRMMRDIEELKSQVHHLRLDRKETSKRLNHLEAENKYMRQMLAALYNNRTVPDIIYENETLRTRKAFPHSRRSQASMNLHYGTIHHQTAASSSLDEQEEEPLHIVETPSTTSTADIAAIVGQRPSEMRNSFSSSDGGSINGIIGGGLPGGQVNKMSAGPIMSPPNFALISTPNEESAKRKKDKPSSNKKLSSDEAESLEVAGSASVTPQELRRELKEAVAARKDADNRIIALEKLVENLQVCATHPPSSTLAHTATDNPPPTPPKPTSQSPQKQQTHPMANGDGSGGGGGPIVKSKPLNNHASGGGPNKPSRRSTPSTAVTSNKPKWSNPSPHMHHPHHATTNSHTNNSASAKLSVAGPITDL